MSQDQHTFRCFRCGCCCHQIANIPSLEQYRDKQGCCRYFDPKNNICQIYDHRPAVCNVETSYALMSDKASWDDYLYTNMLYCVYLRYRAGVPEPEESPFVGMQEEIAQKIMQDMQN